MSIQFGTGGWRAIIGDEFTKENVQLLTAALIQKLKDEGGANRAFSSVMTDVSSHRRLRTGRQRSWRQQA